MIQCITFEIKFFKLALKYQQPFETYKILAKPFYRRNIYILHTIDSYTFKKGLKDQILRFRLPRLVKSYHSQ